MKITIPSYSKNYNLNPFDKDEDIQKYELTYLESLDSDYTVYWGLNTTKLNVHNKYGVMETGYFHNAAFIDTLGGYQNSSLNTKYAYDEISNFNLAGRKSAKEIISSLKPSMQSKYNPAHGRKEAFDQQIVLACQNPADRSITYPYSKKVYMDFVEKCCKFYGKNLFVKLHPWNSNEAAVPFYEIAKKYNCEIDKCHLSLLEGKEFVISFNSTIAVDCCLLNTPHVNYALGTFWNCFGVHYSNHTFPTAINRLENYQKLPDFLIHKYCFDKNMDKDLYVKMLTHYSSSNDIFPMIDIFSYANTIKG